MQKFYFIHENAYFIDVLFLSVKNTKVYIFLLKIFGRFKNNHYLCTVN
jgi:hypothetical protein